MATQGLKDLVGKPRPDLLARCNPDLDAIEQNLVGGLGVAGAPLIVSWHICRDQSDFLKVDGFSSFPSGHASCMSPTIYPLPHYLIDCWGWSGSDC